MARSLAFAKFKVSLEAEIRTFWHILSSQEYASRWLNSISPQPAHLSRYPGDNKNPFKSIDLSVPDFLSHSTYVQACVRENAVVSFITAFEFYLFETLERLIYIDPALINDSSIPIEAKELSLVTDLDIRRWLATKVADKFLRNKTHREMISKIDKFAKAGVAKHSEVEEWGKWSLVRNAVVHTSRFVTSDLSVAWPTRFRCVGDPLNLTDKEVARVHHLALEIASAIDDRAIASTIKDHDAKVLVRELFIQRGVTNPREIRRELDRTLQTRMTVPNVEKLVADQKKGVAGDRWSLSHGDLQKILA
jgi:hypothetical protein